ncbi:MAG: carboxypeptidase regulatory-like domain-containing protein [Gemmatimonadota bacterium]
MSYLSFGGEALPASAWLPGVRAAALGLMLGVTLPGGGALAGQDVSRAPHLQALAPHSHAGGAELSQMVPIHRSLTGTIEGVVEVSRRQTRRAADRYAGGGTGASREEAVVPVVVHLEGGGGRVSAPTSPVQITQQDTSFVPPLTVVPVGAVAEFPNQDPFFHNVFSYSRPKRFDLGRYSQGESKEVEFDEPGYVKIFCEVHGWMRAGVLVVNSPHHTQADSDGRFTLTGVPPGEYTLVATDFNQGSEEVRVRVVSGQTTRVQLQLGR